MRKIKKIKCQVCNNEYPKIFIIMLNNKKICVYCFRKIENNKTIKGDTK